MRNKIHAEMEEKTKIELIDIIKYIWTEQLNIHLQIIYNITYYTYVTMRDVCIYKWNIIIYVFVEHSSLCDPGSYVRNIFRNYESLMRHNHFLSEADFFLIKFYSWTCFVNVVFILLKVVWTSWVVQNKIYACRLRWWYYKLTFQKLLTCWTLSFQFSLFLKYLYKVCLFWLRFVILW